MPHDSSKAYPAGDFGAEMRRHDATRDERDQAIAELDLARAALDTHMNEDAGRIAALQSQIGLMQEEHYKLTAHYDAENAECCALREQLAKVRQQRDDHMYTIHTLETTQADLKRSLASAAERFDLMLQIVKRLLAD